MSARKNTSAALLLESGLREFQRGRLDQAIHAFEHVLRISPGHPDALHLLGVVALQRGDHAIAVERIQQAVAVEPANPVYLANLAYGYVRLSRWPEAYAAFERAARLAPDDPEIQMGIGNCLAMMGKPAEAEKAFRRLVERHPNYALGWFNLANALRDQERYEESRHLYARVTTLAPPHSEAHANLGFVLLKLGEHAAALECYRKADAFKPGVAASHLGIGVALLKLEKFNEASLRFQQALSLEPNFAEAHFQLGNAYRELRKYELAVECYEHALALLPGSALEDRHPPRVPHGAIAPPRTTDFAHKAQVLCNLGLALDYLKRSQEAIACYEQAIALNGEDPLVLRNMGVAYFHQGRIVDALTCYEKALALNPGNPEVLYNMGVVHCHNDNIQGAIPCYAQATELKPEFVEARINYAHCLLTTGEFTRGWENYEWRFRREFSAEPVLARAFPYPEWRGEPLSGKGILVWGEQGVGDEILFASMIPEVAAVAGRCVLECSPKLVPLLARSMSGASVVARSEPPHPLTRSGFDYQAPAGDLARWLRRKLTDFPSQRGYLVAPPEREGYWKQRIAALGPGLKVGFSWRSTRLEDERASYFSRLDQWGPILGVPRVHFINLQYGDCDAELAEARERFRVPLHAYPEVDLFNDLDEAAALTKACDLVISAPTAVAFLAGALGVPTWQMAFGEDWSKHGTDGYPWFPSITLFHRLRRQGWEDILTQIGLRLAEYEETA